MVQNSVRTKELKDDLLNMRKTFMSWDNERRKKVDLAVKALKDSNEYVNLSEAVSRVDEIALKDPSWRELAQSSKRMLKLHYSQLARNDEEKAEAYQRKLRAVDKINDFMKKGLL